MRINPYTLMEDTEQDRKIRQRCTGEIGDGKTVVCLPDLNDRTIQQHQHRAVCLFRKYEACNTCPHNSFTLFFESDPFEKFRVVACPRWNSKGSQQRGKPPDIYVPMEVGTCRERPFEFCSSCPSISDLADMSLDKEQPGWFGRWSRLKEDVDE
jgi:hypothetical protein